MCGLQEAVQKPQANTCHNCLDSCPCVAVENLLSRGVGLDVVLEALDGFLMLACLLFQCADALSVFDGGAHEGVCLCGVGGEHEHRLLDLVEAPALLLLDAGKLADLGVDAAEDVL